MAGLSKSGSFNLGTVPQLQEREELFNTQTIREFNTYSTWDEMLLYNDITNIKFKKDSDGTVHEEPYDKAGYGIKSIFNKWTLVPVLDEKTRNKLNTPLIDTSNTRRNIKEQSNPSIKNLVEQSRIGTLGRETYDYSDFMYCKYLGKMPNNYLVTLRRFPIACNDYIGQVTGTDEREIATSLGCMVTWMGTPGNDMEDILAYSFNMPYEELEAKIEDTRYGDNASPLGTMFAMFDSKYQQQVQAGMAGGKLEPLFDKLHVPFGTPPYSDLLTYRDPNKVYGPVDVVKQTSKRSEKGLTFSHSFKLRFEYELRSYSNINTRQAMLDLLANILTVTYANGAFWGGSYMGLSQSDIFSNLKVMNTKGGVTNFIDAFANDLSTVGSSISQKFKSKEGLLETLKNIANNFGGMLLSGMLNKLGRPDKLAIPSLLSDAPVGLWHVTVGNPFHPIISVGNLILENTEIKHQGPLGLDDFPTKLVVECTLKRAKGRDANEIEKMYNQGVVRVYSGLEQHTMELIKSAPQYNKKSESKATDTEDIGNPTKVSSTTSLSPQPVSATDQADLIARYWQTHNQDAVLLAGREWLRGGGSKFKQSNTGKA